MVSAVSVVKAAVASVAKRREGGRGDGRRFSGERREGRAPRRDDAAAPRRDDSAGRRRFGGDA